MTIKTKSTLRRALSLSAFTVLIAAVTMAFADAPQGRTSVTLKKPQPAVSVSPRPVLRLAEAPKARPKPVTKAAKTTGKKELTGSLNLNSASAKELTKLPGIGPKKAASIVQWRVRHGKFGRVVDLRRVKGFGVKTVRKLQPYLKVSGQNSLQ